MGKTDFDVIVIGGSANGAQAAYSAAKRGISVAVIEEHPTTGIPEHCSGLFSYWGLKELDSMPPSEIVFNYDIYGARIVAPNGKIMTVKKTEKHALVCDRAAFDRFLLNRAIDQGITLYQPYRAITANRENGKVDVLIRNREGDELVLSSNLLISAEGIRANIANDLGLSGPNPKKFVNAAQFYIHDLQGLNKELVEVYQSHKYAPDFFAWSIPMSEDSAKIGLGTSKSSAAKELDKMIKKHPVLRERCKGSEIRRKTAGRIPTTGPVKQTYADNLLLVGDVAGQTKPTTGGGVILGGIAAQLAGEVAADAIKSDKTGARHLNKYEKMWKKEMYSNLQKMQLVRNYMNRLKDNEVNYFFDMLQKKEVLSDIEKYGHVDDQGVLVRKFMTTWRLYPFYLKTFGKLILSFFS